MKIEPTGTVNGARCHEDSLIAVFRGGCHPCPCRCMDSGKKPSSSWGKF